MADFVPNEQGWQGLASAVDGALAAYAEAVAERARANAPIGPTGELRDSIDVAPTGKPIAYRIEAHVPYAVYVELGTADTPAEPFLLPALRSVRAQAYFAGALERLGEAPSGRVWKVRKKFKPRRAAIRALSKKLGSHVG